MGCSIRVTAEPLLQTVATEALSAILEATFFLARLEGFEPPTGCLEDMPWLYGDVCHLEFAVLDVHQDASAAKLVGVG
jgi:hypothetical protein